MSEKKLKEGVGYSTIYYSDFEKIEVSTNNTVLRRTFIKKGRKREKLYERVFDSLRIRKIEEQSVYWKLYDAKKTRDYYIEIQLNAEKKRTGNIRIISHKNAKLVGLLHNQLEVNKEKYIYYVRRKNNEEYRSGSAGKYIRK